MPDDPKTQDGKKPAEGKDTQDGDDKGKDKPPVPAEEVVKLKAAHDQTAAELRVIRKERDDLTTKSLDQDKRLKVLEAEKAPKETGEKIAHLETELARSKAVSKFGLTEEDAERLRGSPEQILDDAEYLSKRIAKPDPKKDPDPKDGDDKDKKPDPPVDPKDGKRPDPIRPAPKPQDGRSWIERYKAATPAERYKMDQEADAGVADPTK